MGGKASTLLTVLFRRESLTAVKHFDIVLNDWTESPFLKEDDLLFERLIAAWGEELVTLDTFDNIVLKSFF